jgi:hypothetical protein
MVPALYGENVTALTVFSDVGDADKNGLSLPAATDCSGQEAYVDSLLGLPSASDNILTVRLAHIPVHSPGNEPNSKLTSAGTKATNPAFHPIVLKIRLYGKRAPLKVVFQIRPSLPHPTVSWQLSFGDGLSNHGSGNPPHFAGHTFDEAGSYHVVLTLRESGGATATTSATVMIP